MVNAPTKPLQSPTVVKFLVIHKGTCNFLENLESLVEARSAKLKLGMLWKAMEYRSFVDDICDKMRHGRPGVWRVV